MKTIARILLPLIVAFGLLTGGASYAAPVEQIEGGDRTVQRLRVTYVEQVAPRRSYVEFNTGATQKVRHCRSPWMVSCVIPSSMTVVLDDGSRVLPARRFI